MLKRLFYASASILMLALAYHLGATTATAQAPGNPVVGFATIGWSGLNQLYATTANGNVYAASNSGSDWRPVGNVFSGGPTPAAQQTWGQLKTQYRK